MSHIKRRIIMLISTFPDLVVHWNEQGSLVIGYSSLRYYVVTRDGLTFD